MLKCPDETGIVILETTVRVFKSIVVQGIRTCILDPWLEASTGRLLAS
jgi:hypothetical protein